MATIGLMMRETSIWRSNDMLPKNIIYQTTKKEIGTLDATSFVHDVCHSNILPLIQLVNGQLYRDHKETVYCLKVDDMYLNNDAECWYKGE